jgi:sec-independent protein translocase protein TatC
MTIIEHLDELRTRIIRMLLGFAVAVVVAWFLYNPIISFLTLPLGHLPNVAPLVSKHHQLLVYGPADPLFIRIKIVAFAAVAIDLPVILWEVWRFIAPGLYAKEKRYAIPFVTGAMALFSGGVALAIVTLPAALGLLTRFSGSQIQLLPSANEYISFVILLMIAFGVAFEFPLLLISLSLVGVLSSKRLRKWRRPAWVVLLVIAGFLTPTQDPITQVLLAVPLAILYEVTIWVTRLLKH